MASQPPPVSLTGVVGLDVIAHLPFPVLAQRSAAALNDRAAPATLQRLAAVPAIRQRVQELLQGVGLGHMCVARWQCAGMHDWHS